jgi:predicted transcriptional regulator
MSTGPFRVYKKFVGFRASDDLHARLAQFSNALGRHQSDVMRYLLVSCLNAYEADKDAIAKIRQDLH